MIFLKSEISPYLKAWVKPFISLGTPSGSTVAATFPTASFKTNQLNSRGTFDQNVYYGIDFLNKDSQQYLAPLPTSVGTGNNVTMSLQNQLGVFFGYDPDNFEKTYYQDLSIIDDSDTLRELYGSKLNDMTINRKNYNIKRWIVS